MHHGRPDQTEAGKKDGTAPDAVKRLVDRFDQDREIFLSGDYKEEQLRAAFPNGPSRTIRHSDFVVRAFSSPFFTALGRDMDDTSLTRF
jgi:hypothetical protein